MKLTRLIKKEMQAKFADLKILAFVQIRSLIYYSLNNEC